MISACIIAQTVLALAAVAILAGGCRKDPTAQQWTELSTGTFEVMGTWGTIRIRCQNAQVGRNAVAAAQEALAKADRLFSTYRPDSELARVNALAGSQAVTISPETYQMLVDAVTYSRQSDGAFDITIAPLLKVWREAADRNELPTEAQLAAARTKVGYQGLILEEPAQPTVRFATPGMELNVDAIAKGRAVDWALEALRNAGAVGGLVEIGGEIGCFGGQGDPWRIGVQDAWVGEDTCPLVPKIRWIIELEEGAVATSGNYRRYYRIAGRRLSHIVDPRTGWPADVLPSVTIIAAQTAQADAIATAASVLGKQAALTWVEQMPGVEALLVGGGPDAEQLYRSSGFRRFEVEGS